MNNTARNLWILTEERPKKRVLEMILSFFAKDHGCGFIGQDIRLIPVLNSRKRFDFTYEVIGFSCAIVNKVYVKTVSGTSSFVDFLVFHQDEMPAEGAEPIYAIEETKTDDKESRNTGVFQRCAKFVYLRFFYPHIKMVMLYALQVEQKQTPTDTYVFGTRLLLTLGVSILGKRLDPAVFVPFNSIQEIIDHKNAMKKPPEGNVPILITRKDDLIEVSGRLIKNGYLGHDPNIGALSIISACLRELGWNKRIVITRHGLQQKNLGKRNKFIQIADRLNLEIEGLSVPAAELPETYWHYEAEGEKLGTIFMHIVVESFTESYAIFENHAGCEKSYFMTSKGEHIPLHKYYDKEAYKRGDKSQIIFIPDLVLLDKTTCEVITVEGKKYSNRLKGIEELALYDAFDELYLQKYYPACTIVRTVVLYGGTAVRVCEVEVGFLLNRNGQMVLGVKAPALFVRALHNLLDYWGGGAS